MGLIAIDDVSQVHVTNFSGEDFVGLADNQCVLKPGAKHTAEWAILPTARPDYWAMVNAVRRLRDVNFKLDGSFAFLRADPQDAYRHLERPAVRRFHPLQGRPVRLRQLCMAHLQGPLRPTARPFRRSIFPTSAARWPGCGSWCPTRSTCCTSTASWTCWTRRPQKYADARLLCADGTAGRLRQAVRPASTCPRTTNRFGRDIAKNVELILGPLPQGFGCEGVYWDEFEYSRYQYHYDDFSRPTGLPWDGVSADIDPRSMKISRLKSSVTLISQPFRLALARRIMQNHLLDRPMASRTPRP